MLTGVYWLLLCWGASEAAQRAAPQHEASRSMELFGKPNGHGGGAEEERCEPSTLITNVADGQTSFGVGDVDGVGASYANNMNCTWSITPQGAPTSITLLFTAFHLESNEDFVSIFDGDTRLRLLTGEQVVPYAVRLSGVGAVDVKFASDEAFHQTGTHKGYEVSTFQVGFAATYFDSSNGECPNDCSGDNGVCANGVCSCNKAYIGGDCSVTVPTLASHVSQNITNLEVGTWAYFQFDVLEHSRVVLELVDFGAPESDPFLVLGNADGGPPTLTPDGFAKTDWFDWYYDTNDLHFIRAVLVPGKYYVGVTNNKERSTELAAAQITYRSSATSWPCLNECNGHGTCQFTGSCDCEEDWIGHTALEGVVTCRYPVDEVSSFPHLYRNDPLRVGDWKYFKFEVTEPMAQGTLLASMWSKAPRARPLLLLRKNTPPILRAGFLPTYDAFESSFGDVDGFDLLNGHQQNIVVSGSNLTAGTWYAGIYNVWGNTGIEVVSHDTADLDLYLNFFQAGTPCARVDDQFCNGEKCDFNTGKCDCPVHKIGSACGFPVTMLTHAESVSHTVPAGETRYYAVEVTEAIKAKNGANLEVVLTKERADDKAYPYLLARKGEVPYSDAYEELDDHDLTAHFYHDQVHSILLDREELTPGIWYFSVENSQESEDELVFAMVATFKDNVACPVFQEKQCAGVGTCDDTRGRCACSEGYTLDDCSADGLFVLEPNTVATETPPIPVDDWAFWVAPMGCENMTVTISVREGNASSVHDAAPLLVMRKDKLPLMMEGATDYYDYFKGTSDHSSEQGIRITGCERPPCVVRPYRDHGGGTEFATGSPKPGIYFVGIYNDATEAVVAITDYRLNYAASSCAGGSCASGFVGEECQLICPGMIPAHAYSNTPFSSGIACNQAGTCVQQGGKAVCECDDLHFGPVCATACPGITENGTKACSGRGACSLGGSGPVCACEDGYAGEACELECPGASDGDTCSGHGACALVDGAPTCRCSEGYVGASCSSECPGRCSGHGHCTSVRDSEGGAEVATCACTDGYVGASCALQCPGVEAGLLCDGNGTCAPDTKDSKKASCSCFHGHIGLDCSQPVESLPPGVSASDGSQYGGIAAGLSIVVVILACIAGYFVYVARKRKEALDKYRHPMLEDDGHPASDADPTGNADAPMAHGSTGTDMREVEVEYAIGDDGEGPMTEMTERESTGQVDYL